MIEKIIHVFSNEDNEIIQNNKKILNDFKYILWNKSKVEEYSLKKNINNSEAKFYIICEYGGIFTDQNYIFFKNINIFLYYNFISVFNNDKLKFFGSKKNNNIIENIIKKYGKFDEIYFKEMKIKIINPIYLYPEIKNDYYSVVEVNKNYIFGANKIDSAWVFENSINNIQSRFPYNTREFYFLSNNTISKNTNGKDILIVIAHPDDEILWFGDLIINFYKDIKVLCITCQSNKKRLNEYINIMEKCNLDYEIWDHINDSSYLLSNEIKEKLINIIPNHKYFFTHSLSGESGHPLHILINKYMFDIVNENLYVANPYNLNKKLSDKKIELLNMYESQSKSIKKYLHITEREDYLQIK